MAQDEQLSQSLEEIRQGARNSGFFTLLGMQIDRAQEGQGTVGIHVDARLLHPQQIVHGGVIFTLADTAMSMALLSMLGPDIAVSTIEAKINYLRPVRTGELSAEASILHQGRTTAVLEASVYNTNGEERKEIARVLGTFHIHQSRTA